MIFRKWACAGLAGMAAFITGLVLLADTGHAHWMFDLASRVPIGDKLAHFALAGMLTFLADLTFPAEWRIGRWRLFKASLLLVVLSTLEECSQAFSVFRTFDLGDLAANLLGIWVFSAVARWYIDTKYAPRAAAVERPEL